MVFEQAALCGVLYLVRPQRGRINRRASRLSGRGLSPEEPLKCIIADANDVAQSVK
jgi:hypothetical protein